VVVAAVETKAVVVVVRLVDNANVVCNYCKEKGHMKYSCPKLELKNGGGNSGGAGQGQGQGSGGATKSESPSSDKSDLTFMVVDKYGKLSGCDRCGEIGLHGMACAECLTGKYTRLVSKDSVNDLLVGQCPNCGDVGFGMLGNYCKVCTDSGMVYETIQDVDSIHGNVEEEEEDEEEEDDNELELTYPDQELLEHSGAILAVVKPNRDELFMEMLGLVRRHQRTRYEIKVFLEVVGKYIFPDWDTNRVKCEFVQTYVYSLVHLSIEKVSQLMSVVASINGILRSVGQVPFDNWMLSWISAFGPIWNIADYRYSIRGQFPLPSASETAFVEYSYFIANKTTNNNMWIGDSGASCHMTCSLDRMVNVREIDLPVQVGTGEAIECTKIGDKRLCAIQEDGTIRDVVLKDCKFVPGLFTNLFSITKALEGGCSISNKGISISLTKGEFSICFDKTLRTDTGAITGVEMVPHSDVAQLTLERGQTINVNKLHLLLGHSCESTMRVTAKHYGLILKGSYMVCTDCALNKAHQKNVPKESHVVLSKPGERFFLDISSTKATSFGGNKFWLLVIDHHTNMCWSYFLAAKSHLAEMV
jgi:hypothetical protein